MPTEDLKNMLRKVHAELESTDDLPEQEEQSLRALLEDIEDRLDELDNDSVGERVSAAMGEFQATHPTLAFTLRRLVDTLQKMGI